MVAGDPRRRNWDDENPQYDDPDKFTIHLEHNGFFCGLKENLYYVSGTGDFWDNCCTDTFSLLWIEEFIKEGGNEMTARTSVYWRLHRKSLSDGLCLLENDSHILAMMRAVQDEKTLCLMVDHTNFLKDLRGDVAVPIPAKYTCQYGCKEIENDNGDSENREVAVLEVGGPFAAEKDNEDEKHSDPLPKEHLTTLYWSYDACKRGFLEGCRPLICIDGCHIKTRYKDLSLDFQVLPI